ncbi:MAG: T9SS type A sorting domain-containing protein [Chitinophagaceae bacterium]|nr:T9SS type A sorting domain-containing protein [Chitinophagaceae bacterium]
MLYRAVLVWGIFFLFFSARLTAQYNYYYGNLHSHTSYSDGNQDEATSGLSTPAQDYNYAKSSFHMDYLGISDHNHYLAGMKTPAFYHSGVSQATASNQDGTFVCLYGMEWGVISNGGHVLIYGIDDLIGWDKQADGTTNDYDVFCAKSDYPSLWPIVNSYPGAFCTLAHPNTNDYSFLTTAAFNNAANQAISGSAFRSGSAFSTTTDYTDPAATSYETYYKSLLAKGYHAAPQIDADNHNTTFGRTHQGRTVVLAASLSRANILDALKNRRYYASDDWNAQVVFTVSGNYMGADATIYNNSVIGVSVTDPDAGDNVSSIQIYYGVPGSGTSPAVLTSNSSTASLNYTHVTTFNNKFYYYARIVQADGNVIVTAPVWITRSSVFLPVDGLTFNGEERNRNAWLEWTAETEGNVSYYAVERSVDGQNFSEIGRVNSLVNNSITAVNYNFNDDKVSDGTYFYRLRQVDLDGRSKYSVVISISIHKPLLELVSLYPNPVADQLNLRFQSLDDGAASCRIYSEEGREVMAVPLRFVRGVNDIKLDAGSLQAGLYFLVLQQPDRRILETRFIKQ